MGSSDAFTATVTALTSTTQTNEPTASSCLSQTDDSQSDLQAEDPSLVYNNFMPVEDIPSVSAASTQLHLLNPDWNW
jgi:hypothetical protein